MAANNITEAVTQESPGPAVFASARVPAELWQSIRRAAVDRKTTAQDITIEALRQWLAGNPE